MIMHNDDRQTDFGWTVDLAPRPRSSLSASKEARDEAVSRAGDAAEADGWMQIALEAIRDIAAVRDEFTADDVWQAGLEPPRESRALGAAFTRLQRDGVIEATAKFKTTARASRHAAPIRIWRSLIKSKP